MTGWRDFASVFAGGVQDTSVVLFVSAAPEEEFRAPFSAEMSSCKKVTAVFANILKTNRTFAKMLCLVRGGAFYAEH